MFANYKQNKGNKVAITLFITNKGYIISGTQTNLKILMIFLLLAYPPNTVSVFKLKEKKFGRFFSRI